MAGQCLNISWPKFAGAPTTVWDSSAWGCPGKEQIDANCAGLKSETCFYAFSCIRHSSCLQYGKYAKIKLRCLTCPSISAYHWYLSLFLIHCHLPLRSSCSWSPPHHNKPQCVTRLNTRHIKGPRIPQTAKHPDSLYFVYAARLANCSTRSCQYSSIVASGSDRVAMLTRMSYWYCQNIMCMLHVNFVFINPFPLTIIPPKYHIHYTMDPL